MKNYRQIVLLALLFVIWMDMRAKNEWFSSGYAYRRYTTQDGLPQMLTECLYTDSKGFVWIGTLSGFARYDGFRFQTFLSGREENIIRMYNDDKGNFSALGFRKRYQLKTGSDSVDVISFPGDWYLNGFNSRSLPFGCGIYENKQGNEKIVCQVSDTGLVKIFTHECLNEIGEFRKPYWDRQQQRFFIPTERGVYVIKENGVKSGFYKGIDVDCFIPDNAGLYAIGAGGIYTFSENNFRQELNYPFTDFLSGAWAVVSEKGLIVKDKNTIYRYRNDRLEKIFSGINSIRDLIIDPEGNLWAATYDGLYNFFGLDFKTNRLNVREDIVRTVVSDRSGNTYFGTLTGKLLCVNTDGTCREIAYPPNRDYEYFFNPGSCRFDDELYFTGGGDILCCKDYKCNRLNLPFDNYKFVKKMFNGKLVAGSSRQILVCDSSGKIIRTYNESGLKQPFYYCIETDNKQRLWIGGPKGITIVDDENIKTIFTDSIKLCSVITSDRNGNIMFACENRLYRAKGDSAELFRTFDNTLIRSLLFIKDNRLIVATLKGVYIINPENGNTSFYNRYNGFTSIEPMKTPMTEDSSGNVWIPTLENIVSFNPEDLSTRRLQPRLHILSVQHSPDNINWKKVQIQHERVLLNHTARNLKIEYIGLCYSAAENVRYSFRLQGFQEDWSEPQPDKHIFFNNLSPGTYLLQLKADAGDPLSESDIISLVVEIKPAFWQTWWFVTICTLLVLSIFSYIFYSYYRKKVSKQTESLKREIQLNELRVESIRLKSIPHFNSNVLAGIEYYVMNYSKEETNKFLSVYAKFSNLTLREVDKACRSLEDELEYVKLYLNLEKMRFRNKLYYAINIDEKIDQTICIPNMVLHTYCENAIKHGLRHNKTVGLLNICAVNALNGVIISVEDNGIGREEAARRNTSGTGEGLKILLRQIEMYNQLNKENIVQEIIDLKDEEKNPRGTIFKLFVPYKYQYI